MRALTHPRGDRPEPWSVTRRRVRPQDAADVPIYRRTHHCRRPTIGRRDGACPCLASAPLEAAQRFERVAVSSRGQPMSDTGQIAGSTRTWHPF